MDTMAKARQDARDLRRFLASPNRAGHRRALEKMSAPVCCGYLHGVTPSPAAIAIPAGRAWTILADELGAKYRRHRSARAETANCIKGMPSNDQNMLCHRRRILQVLFLSAPLKNRSPHHSANGRHLWRQKTVWKYTSSRPRLRRLARPPGVQPPLSNTMWNRTAVGRRRHTPLYRGSAAYPACSTAKTLYFSHRPDTQRRDSR